MHPRRVKEKGFQSPRRADAITSVTYTCLSSVIPLLPFISMAKLNKNNSGKHSLTARLGRPGHSKRLTEQHAAVKRIMQEARELANDPCTDYSAAPLEVFLLLSALLCCP